MGFLFTTDFGANHCTSSSASMGSYSNVSEDYNSASFSAASMTLAAESRTIINYLSSVTVTTFSSFYTPYCSDEATAITVTKPATMPTTWAYTVGSGDGLLLFDAFTCSAACTLTYTANINGGSDYGALQSLLSINSATRTFTLSSSTTSTYVGTYTLYVYGTASSSTTDFDVATITLTISAITITLNPSVAVPSTWAYTVGTGAQTLTFSSFTCSSSCGTISYSAYLSG